FESESVASGRNDTYSGEEVGLTEVGVQNGHRRDASPSDGIHPTGFEPVTFGSVGNHSSQEYVQEHPELTPRYVKRGGFARRCNLMRGLAENCGFLTWGLRSLSVVNGGRSLARREAGRPGR